MSSASSVEGFLPTPSQVELWRSYMDGHSRICQLSARINTRLDSGRMDAAIREALHRHEIARTRYLDIPGMSQPLQLVGDEVFVDVRHTDVRIHGNKENTSIEVAAKEAALDHVLSSGKNTPRGIVDVITVSDSEALLVLTLPHLMADEASLAIILNDLLDLYAGSRQAEQKAIQFLDYSEWFNEQRKGAMPDSAQSYLNSLLHLSYPDVFPLHAPEGAEAEVKYGGYLDHDFIDATLDAQLRVGIEAFLKKYSVRADALFLLAWALSLRRVGGKGTFKIDNYSTGRLFDDLSHTVGPLGEYRPVSIAVEDDDEEVLAAAQRLSALLNETDELWPFLGGWTRRNQDKPVSFIFKPRPSVAGENVPVSAINVDVVGEPHALSLSAHWDLKDARLRVAYDRRSFDRGIAERLMDATILLLKHTVSAPQRPVSSIRTLITETERELITAASGGRVPAIDTARCIHHAIEERVVVHPNATAVVSGEVELTFLELNAQANRVAHALARIGVRPTDRVAIVMRRSADSIIAILGILKAGACYVPIDVDSPPARLRQLIREAGVSVVITDADLASSSQQVVEEWPCRLLTIAETTNEAAENYRAIIEPSDPAYIIFTSGSTGMPKGVIVPHGAVVNLVKAIQSRIYGNTSACLRVAVNAPIVFDASVKQIFQLVNGHCLCIISDDTRADPHKLLSYLRDKHVDVLDCTPSHLQGLLLASSDRSTSLPSVVLVGGEPITPQMWHELSMASGTRYLNVYGPTEATVDTTFAEIRRDDPPNIGRPLPGVRTYIVDDELKLVAPGERGELCIGGAGVARGYFGDPARTSDRFVADPYAVEADSKMYRSGDIVRMLPDGKIAYIGRSDTQVKLRGLRIELGEIENVLCEHPSVHQAAVALQTDEADDQTLVAYVVPKEPNQWTREGGKLRRADGDEIAQMNWVETQYLSQEIFEKKTYLQEGIQIPDDACVLDVGANIGVFSLFVAAYAARPHILAFEPLAPIREKLIANVRGMDGRVEVFDYGLSREEREDEFTFYPNYSMMSSSAGYADAQAEIAVIRRALENDREDGIDGRAELLSNIDAILEDRFTAERHVCKLRRLSDVIRQRGIACIDLLKVDVQRAELDVLEGIDDDDWPRIKQIVAEVHDCAGTATEGRLDIVSDLLEEREFEVRIHQDSSLRGTDRFNVYAWRPEYRAAKSQTAGEGKGKSKRETPGGADLPLGPYLESRLPGYMVPRAIVELTEIPLTKNGKIDRKALPKPAIETSGRKHELVEPENDVERALHDVWSQVLRSPSFGVTDNFFDLGGDSIRSIRVQVLARERGIHFGIQDLFNHQTIRGLLQAVAGREKSAVDRSLEPSVAVPAPFELISPEDQRRLPPNIENAFPLSALQWGMVYHAELTNQATTYHNSTSYRVKAPFDEALFCSCLNELLNAHPILRSGFSLGEFSEPLQLVYGAAPLPLTVTDLSSLREAEQETAISAAVSRELATFFDFAKPPMFRILVHRRGALEFQITVAEFHAILDGLSLHLMITELFARYAAGLGYTRKYERSAPGLAFDAFVAMERNAAAAPESREFWSKILAGVKPFRLSRSQSDGHCEKAMQRLDWQLPAKAYSLLQTHAKSYSLPLKYLLLAAHIQSLRQLSGQEDLVTGLITSGRPELADGDRVLGLFINTVPFRARPAPAPQSWVELARSAFEAETAMLPYRRVPLGNILRWTDDRQLFDVFFNFTQFEASEWRSVTEALGIAETRHIATDIDFGLAVDFEVDVDSEAVRVVFQYDANNLSTKDMERLMGICARAIAALSEGPEQIASTLAPANPNSQCANAEDFTETHGNEDAGREPPADDDEVESRLKSIWSDVLGRDHIDRHICFGDLGGHSLLAVQAVSRIRAETKVPLTLPEFLKNATLAELSGLISIKMGNGGYGR